MFRARKTFLSLTVIVFLLFAHGRAEVGFQAKRIDGKQGSSLMASWMRRYGNRRLYMTRFIKRSRPTSAQLTLRLKCAFCLMMKLYMWVSKHMILTSSSIRNSFSRRDRITIDQDFLRFTLIQTSAHKSAQIFWRQCTWYGYGWHLQCDAAGEDSSPDFNF